MRNRRALPILFADMFGLGQKTEFFAAIQQCLPILTPLETLHSPSSEGSFKFRDKRERLRCENFREGRRYLAEDLHTGGRVKRR